MSQGRRMVTNMTTTSRLPLLHAPPTGSTDACSTSRAPNTLALPHFKQVNGDCVRGSPRKRRHEPEDTVKTPIDQAIDDIRHITHKIRESFARMDQSERLFERECAETRAYVDRICAEQQDIAQAYLAFFQFSARQVQRVYRGHRGRNVCREAIALRSALKIQRAYRAMQARRAERRRQFRILSRKILRGLRGVKERFELPYTELLDRVSHNMMIERQWRMAMGVADTENDLMSAIYRRKFVRKRLVSKFNEVLTTSSIVKFWKGLIPRPVVVDAPVASVGDAVADLTLDLQDVFITSNEQAAYAIDEEEPTSAAKAASLFAVTQQLSTRSKQSNALSRTPKLSREELIRKQKLYTQRIHEENMKKEAARAAQLEKQRELARQAEAERKQLDEEQRKLRLEQAQALREDLERRGLLAIKGLQSKKEEEMRKEELAQQRIFEAKKRIAQEVLSDETQLLLMKKERQGGGTKLPVHKTS